MSEVQLLRQGCFKVADNMSIHEAENQAYVTLVRTKYIHVNSNISN